MNARKKSGFISSVRLLFAMPENDTRTVDEICNIRSAFVKEAEQVALRSLTMAVAFTLAAVLGLLIYGFNVNQVRLLVVGVAFGVAYYSVFAASVAYASAMCDPRKLSPAGQHFTSAIGAYR